MATTTVSRNDLVGLSSLSFIRPIRLSYSITGTKPGTRLYAFFDGKAVNQYITPTSGTKGQAVITDSAGAATGTFDIPPMSFNTGERVLKFQDDPNFNLDAIPGATTGSAEAIFSSTGLLKTYRETITNTTVNDVERIVIQPRPTPIVNFRVNDDSGGGNDGGDPLAQTFFTYGIKGGCFITKIDLYFQSKDTNLPVILQIRDVVNGYPGKKLVSSDSSVTLNPSQVNLSNDSSAVTTFTFNAPVYLEENKEYCFVLLSNSNKYHVWTSELGKQSVETGKIIFEQPHIGSLFKSENNSTWTAEQTQDIKFTLYKAKFDTTEREIIFKTNAQPVLLSGSNFSVTSGSPVVTVKFDFQHGFKTGDKIILTGQTGATYRGITSATISNVAGFTVTRVDDYNLTFNVGTNATSTGTLETSGILNAVEVDNTGSGYVAPVITISAPAGGGTTATASASVVGGKIVSVTVTNPGTTYTEAPTYTLSDASGTGAQLAPISEGLFVANINRLYQSAVPVVSILEPPQTSSMTTLRASSYATYALGTHTIHQLNETQSVNMDAVLPTTTVETASFGGNASTQMIVRLYSNNPNVSPMIDLTDSPPRLQLFNMLINTEANVASETTNTGTAYSRYISKPVTLETVSIGAKVFVNAASVNTTSFDVFIRTSLSTSDTNHTDGTWVKMDCSVDRNISSTIDEYLDYEFYKEGISPFDVYDIKIVLSSQNKYVYPIIDNYRVIILAT